jgi:tellurite resistance protein
MTPDAILAAVTAVCTMVTKIIDSQTPEQRARFWELTLKNQEDFQAAWKHIGDLFGRVLPPKP